MITATDNPPPILRLLTVNEGATPASSPETLADGRRVQRFDLDLLRVGKFGHDAIGLGDPTQIVDVSGDLLDELVKAFDRMKAGGLMVNAAPDFDDQPEQALGQLVELRRVGSRLVGTVQAIGDEAIKAVRDRAAAGVLIDQTIVGAGDAANADRADLLPRAIVAVGILATNPEAQPPILDASHGGVFDACVGSASQVDPDMADRAAKLYGASTVKQRPATVELARSESETDARARKLYQAGRGRPIDLAATPAGPDADPDLAARASRLYSGVSRLM